jgi:hypothetical protein
MANDRSVFAIDRALYNGPLAHSFFKDEPFTEREAWVWMIGEAAFAPHQRRIGRTAFDLKRGQLVAATRFLAVKWKWTDSRVRRFLQRLQACSMVEASMSKEATLRSVCKYNDYQFDRRTRDAPATHPRRKEEEINKPLDRGDTRAREGFQISAEAFAFADELAVICGQDRNFLTPQWVSGQPAVRAQMWLNAGWQVPVMREAAIAAVRKKRDGPPSTANYFDKIFARAHAPLLPLPTVQVVFQKENVHAAPATNIGRSNWSARADRRSDAHARLKASIADDAARESGETGCGQVVRSDRGSLAG